VSDAATEAEPEQSSSQWRWLRSIGPGLVTACVVIGPGSIMTSSKVGSSEGYANIWVVIVSVYFMMIYTTLAVKFGVVTQRSAADVVSEHAGRWLAVLVGISVFFIAAAYQFGNNLGVHAALEIYVPFKYWIVVFNALAMAFLFGFKDLYKWLERLMSVFVSLMLIAFAINLFFARPDVSAIAAGLNPLPRLESGGMSLELMGLVGTTFVIAAAYYQSYLARFKGWQVKDIPNALIDARVSAIIMALITLMLMSTAAAVLQGEYALTDKSNLGDVAEALKPLFGETGRAIFCVGVFSAAFSSFIVNSMIGGFLLSDALGLGSTPEDRSTRIFTASVLLIGMGVALYMIVGNVGSPVQLIVAAQVATVVAAPLIAVVLLWLTNNKKIMGEHVNGIGLNMSAVLGLVLLAGISANTVINKVLPRVTEMMSGGG